MVVDSGIGQTRKRRNTRETNVIETVPKDLSLTLWQTLVHRLSTDQRTKWYYDVKRFLLKLLAVVVLFLKQDIKFAVHAHPTLSEVLDELFKAAKV